MPETMLQKLPTGFSQNDFALIRELRDVGVLRELRPEEFRADTGTVPVLCSDGDRAWDVFNHHTAACMEANFPIRPHVIAYPGAPILLSRHSPAVLGIHIDRLLIYGIKTGPEMKQIKTVVIVPHWPCGMAKLCNLDFIRTLELSMNGKARLKRELTHAVKEIVVCLHVDYGENKQGERIMRTYHIDQQKWLRWITTKKHGEQYPTDLYLASMPL